MMANSQPVIKDDDDDDSDIENQVVELILILSLLFEQISGSKSKN